MRQPGELGKVTVKESFEHWLHTSRHLQIRAVTALTASLYVIYALLERFIAPVEVMPLLMQVHLYINAPMLFAISALTFFPRYDRYVVPSLFVSPLIAASGNMAIVVALDGAVRYLPEIYLMLFWIFTISGLGLRSAALCGFLVLLLTEYGTTWLVTLSEDTYWMHQFWLLAAFSFGVLGAYLLEKSKKTIYHNHLKLEAQAAELVHLASTDKMTGLYNRAKLDEALNMEMERSRRYGHPLGVILMDIDHFKKINDTYGHPVGDDVLIKLAKLLDHNTRITDTLGRWGGEEFVIISPHTDRAGVIHLAENLRHNIEAHTFESVGRQTASFGVTLLRDEDTAASVIKRADDALYSAKAEGRNRVDIR